MGQDSAHVTGQVLMLAYTLVEAYREEHVTVAAQYYLAQ
jgi:hypothetical protein